MNAQKYTQKSLEAIQAAQQLTIENQNQQIEQVHLLASLLRQENGLAPQLLRKMGITVESLDAAVLQELGKLPRVTGSGREADKYYVARAVDEALSRAEKIADEMKDDFVSVEHLLLALIETADSTLKRLFSTYNITKERCLQALQSIRGNQRVTTDKKAVTAAAKQLIQNYGADIAVKDIQGDLQSLYDYIASGYDGKDGYKKADGTVIGTSTYDVFGKTFYDISYDSMTKLGFPINADAHLITNDNKLNGSNKQPIRDAVANGAKAYLVNTGWNGTGKRISIKDTRGIIDAILSGAINTAPTKTIPVFGFEVPTELPGVDPAILDPRDTYANVADWEAKAADLAGRFVKNFAKYEGNEAGKALVAAGPKA